MNIMSPLSTYIELTVTEPYKTLRDDWREKHKHEPRRIRTFWLRALKRSLRRNAPPTAASPLVLSSPPDDYVRRWR